MFYKFNVMKFFSTTSKTFLYFNKQFAIHPKIKVKYNVVVKWK